MLKKLQNFIDWYKKSFPSSDRLVEYNIYLLGIACIFGHPLYWFLWTFVDPQKFESFFLRFSATILSIPLLLFRFWPKSLKKYFSYYWFFIVFYNLSFLFTVNFILNDFSVTWSCGMMASIFFSVMLLSNPVTLLLNITTGFLAGICYVIFIHRTLVNFDENFFITYIPLFSFGIFIGYAFSYSNFQGVKSGERSRIFKSLAGSIAHELRNPLNVVSMGVSQLESALPEISDSKIKNEITQINQAMASSLKQANNTIDIILSDLAEKPINSSQFSLLSAQKVIPAIIASYGFKNLEDKQKVVINIDPVNDFYFKANLDRFTFIIYNLLKNALYYLNQFPQALITIGTEKRRYRDKDYNVIFVHDTGPGIKPDIINKLFTDFFTNGKEGGTGLGLSFCKRNMRLFGGDIICESKFGVDRDSSNCHSSCENRNDYEASNTGGWTKFSLLFPIVEKTAIADNADENLATKSYRKHILIIDNNQRDLDLVDLKTKIEKNLPFAICVIAENPLEALKIMRGSSSNLFDMVIFSLKKADKIVLENIKQIHNLISSNQIPYLAIIEDNNHFRHFITDNKLLEIFNATIPKSSPDYRIIRNIAKYLTADGVNEVVDDLCYVENEEEFLKVLVGKKLILADDQQVNRLMVKKNLVKAGIEVVEVRDGEELLQVYRDSLDKKGCSDFDIIVTDINMPPHNGDEASKRIREIELVNKSKRIPIIALSGEANKANILYFFKCQIDDYFVKGYNPSILLKILAVNI